MRVKALLAMSALLLAFAGCGSGDESEPQSTSSSTQAARGQEPKADSERSEAKDHRSKQGEGTQPSESKPDPQLQRLRQNFPKPKPAPGAKQTSAKAIQAGEEACRGLTPEEVKERFFSEAEPNLDPDQIAVVEELPRYEEEASQDPSFVAGQIAATIYGATLGEAESGYGFQGCVYVLARGLEGEVSGSE
jgi:hypothetical protein